MKRAEIEQLLPEVFQRTVQAQSPLNALLQLMEDLHAQAEDQLGDIEKIFDPRRTPDKFVAYLASWVDLGRVFPDRRGRQGQSARGHDEALPLGRLRELTAASAWLSRWRGTRKGLLRFLIIATGDARIRIEENITPNGAPHLYNFVVFAPEELRTERELLEAIIASEKPVFATHDLVFVESPKKPAPI